MDHPQLVLAAIDENRRLSHQAGQIVYMTWDQHVFCFQRSDLSAFARTLEQGMRKLYTGHRDYSVVAVDDTLRDVWIGKTCLSLDCTEYRALLNATLTTETRLHGFRTVRSPEAESAPAQPTVAYCLPAPVRLYWN